MKRNSKNNTVPIADEFADFFSTEPDANEKAWGLIHDFYHGILSYMGKNNISRSDLAKKLNLTRPAISQMFNKTPNVTLKKMVEIADALNQNLKISFETIGSNIQETDIRPIKASFVSAGASDVLSGENGNIFKDQGVNSSMAEVIPIDRKRRTIATSDNNSDFLDAANG